MAQILVDNRLPTGKNLEAREIYLMEYKGKSERSCVLTWKARAIANLEHQASGGCHHAEFNLAWTFAKCSMPREIKGRT